MLHIVFFGAFLFFKSNSKTIQSAQSINDFGHVLLADLYSKNSNLISDVFVSPYSINSALLLTAVGAVGSTFTEFMQVLRIKNVDDSKLILGDKDIRNVYHTKKAFISVNSVWVNKKIKVNEHYKISVTKTFNSSVISSDFSSKKFVQTVNKFISDQTNGTINNVIKGVDPRSLIMLINTLYFNGKWTHKFDSHKTRPAKFCRLNNTTVKASFMYQVGDFDYYTDKNVSAAILPFSSGPSLLLIKPQVEGKDALLSVVQNYLTHEKITHLLSKSKRFKLDLSVPKFNASYSLSASDVLHDLGLKKAFSPFAEFPLISKQEVMINEVLHEARLSVGEEGAIASAATVVMMEASMSPGSFKKVRPSIDFTLDRPFVFVLLDKDRETALVLGTIRDVDVSLEPNYNDL